MKRRDFVFSAVLPAAGAALLHPAISRAFEDDSAKRPMPVERSPVPVHKEDVGVALVDGKTILTGCKGETITLNDTGAAVWEAIDGKRDCYVIADILRDGLGLKNAEVSGDVREFVGTLVQRGYLKIARTTPCYRLDKITGSAAILRST